MADNQQYDFSGLDEVDKALPSNQGSDLEDIGRGLASGATLGLAPQIAGGVEATGDKLKDLLSGAQGKSWLENYRAREKASQAAFAASKARSPYLYGTGQLVGTVAPVLASGGLGAGAEAGAALEGAGGFELAPTLAERAIGVAEQGGIGGIIGGTSALGESEGNVETEEGRKKLLSDVTGGIASGTVLGAGLGAAGEVISQVGKPVVDYLGDKASSIVNDSPLLKKMNTGFEYGKQGIKLNASDEAKAGIGARRATGVQSITDSITGADTKLGEAVGNSVNAAEESGIKVQFPEESSEDASTLVHNIQNSLEDIQTLSDGQKEILGQQLSELSAGNLSPKEAIALRENLLGVGRNIKRTVGTNDFLKQASELDDFIKEGLDSSIPDYAESSRSFENFRSSVAEPILSDGGLKPVRYGKLANKEAKLNQGVDRLLGKLGIQGPDQSKAQNILEQITKNLGEFEKNNPGVLDELGINPDVLKSAMQDTSTDIGVGTEVQKRGFEGAALGRSAMGAAVGGAVAGPVGAAVGGSAGLLSGVGGTATGKLIKQANLAGRAAKYIADNPIANLSKSVYAMSDNGLKAISEHLTNTPGVSDLGTALGKAVEQKNEITKNAALFAIMQNPQARLAVMSVQSPQDYDFGDLEK